MKKTLIGLLTVAFLAVSAWAQEARLKPDHPDRYTVVKGDTLWDISDKFLQNPWMWPEIWHVNPQISNPHLIYPGDTIALIYIDGRPLLTVERGPKQFKMSPGDTKLSPSIHVLPLGDAIPAIPLDEIDNFLSRSRILDAGQLEAAPHVIAAEGGRLVVGAGDFLYARGEFADDVPVYGVYRQGDVYVDPETEEVLGYQAMDIGTAKYRTLEEDIATLTVTRTTQEIRIRDRLLPHEERSIESTFFPSPPESDIEGVIMAVEGGVSQVGKLDVVILNRGDREGLKVGNVLAVYKHGVRVRDRVRGDTVTLPDERAGLLMVFRTFDKMSFGLILESDQPLSVSDKVRKP
ncbi:LysM peptidoglycan-binding domain-containing protein [Exilibacterium tricleocarpae]|uniref:LysM peptidoglycan-binding domain-containing protein n=1 Tax=Exilibacterium tricleocarpae TaxID=2591008 RepID=A0A545T0I2_9GAMM|nr:LysM peptidoglycan-binding domain-containing protein [Exilibacterium tricleocarpae]TQV70689.1 LysM peptidoglycan-binding domain-containing protein [Exilibacterium tricleocarpae]